MRAVLRSIGSLVALTVLAGAALAWFAAHTEEAARRNRMYEEWKTLLDMAGEVDRQRLIGFADDADDAPPDDWLLCEMDLAILRGTGKGYGGAFRLAVAIRTDDERGSIKAVRILAHAETPGFADMLAAGSPWLDSFAEGEVHAVTGATITSLAVREAVARTMARFEPEGTCRP